MICITCEIVGNLKPLTEPDFGSLVNRIVGSQGRQPRLGLERLVRKVVKAWARERAATGAVIGIHPLRAPRLPGSIHPWEGIAGY